ncbi:conserved hypothetical protein [Burkholderiales bacterium 8X]|nr:conserved hypothetical protein [Burkholderiales bacterium 8X]
MNRRGSMYQQALGAPFDRLHPALRKFHRLQGRHVLFGEVETHAPASMPAKLLARCLGTPLRSGRGEIRFELDAPADSESAPVESWTRHFPGRTMRSRLALAQGAIVERLGPVRLAFMLQEHEGRLSMRLVRMHVAGVRCPGWLLPQVLAEETGGDGRIEFRISASLAHIGEVAGYHGHLLLPGTAS